MRLFFCGVCNIFDTIGVAQIAQQIHGTFDNYMMYVNIIYNDFQWRI